MTDWSKPSRVQKGKPKPPSILATMTVDDLVRARYEPVDHANEYNVTTLTREQYHWLRENDPNRVRPVVESVDGGEEGS